MSIFTFYNCIVAGVIAWIMAGLFTEETHERAAGVLVVLFGLNKHFKAVLRAFKCLGYKYTIMAQKAVFGACRHLKRLYTAPHSIQAKQKTATAAGLLSGFYNVVSRTTKHSFDKYLWLMVYNPTIYCGLKNGEKLRCVCHFGGF